MKKSSVIRGLFFVLLQFAAIAAVHAQATRTWVSGVGDDANPCSRTAPCKTFAGAISKTAPSGEINCLDPGGFGAVTITKAITIDCGNGGGIAGVLVSGTNGIVVAAGASDVVVLRNLDIDGLGTGLAGIKFLSGRGLHVENCKIYSFTQFGIDAQLVNVAGTHSLFVSGTKLLNNLGASSGGIAISTAAANSAVIDSTITNTIMQGNAFGLFAGDHAKVAVNNTVASSNVGDGFAAQGTSTTAVLFLDNGAALLNGGTGANAKANSTIRLGHMQISGNTTGLAFVAGSSLQSFGNNDVTGNVTNGNPSATIPST